MKKRQEFLWIIINLLMTIICIVSPELSGDQLDVLLGGIFWSLGAWYFAGLLDLVLFKRKG